MAPREPAAVARLVSGNPLDGADAVALTLDREGRLGYVNRAAERLFGKPA